jgi:hypothetical protein|tara:strand:- start:384 stop:572 length:189 start_codon:yes stop_codon:yes gene_type:complete
MHLLWRGENIMMLVTKEDVSQWVGNGFDDSREEAFIEIITDVANGEYDIEQLNADIRSLFNG